MLNPLFIFLTHPEIQLPQNWRSELKTDSKACPYIMLFKNGEDRTHLTFYQNSRAKAALSPGHVSYDMQFEGNELRIHVYFDHEFNVIAHKIKIRDLKTTLDKLELMKQLEAEANRKASKLISEIKPFFSKLQNDFLIGLKLSINADMTVLKKASKTLPNLAATDPRLDQKSYSILCEYKNILERVLIKISDYNQHTFFKHSKFPKLNYENLLQDVLAKVNSKLAAYHEYEAQKGQPVSAVENHEEHEVQPVAEFKEQKKSLLPDTLRADLEKISKLEKLLSTNSLLPQIKLKILTERLGLLMKTCDDMEKILEAQIQLNIFYQQIENDCQKFVETDPEKFLSLIDILNTGKILDPKSFFILALHKKHFKIAEAILNSYTLDFKNDDVNLFKAFDIICQNAEYNLISKLIDKSTFSSLAIISIYHLSLRLLQRHIQDHVRNDNDDSANSFFDTFKKINNLTYSTLKTELARNRLNVYSLIFAGLALNISVEDFKFFISKAPWDYLTTNRNIDELVNELFTIYCEKNYISDGYIKPSEIAEAFTFLLQSIQDNYRGLNKLQSNILRKIISHKKLSPEIFLQFKSSFPELDFFALAILLKHDFLFDSCLQFFQANPTELPVMSMLNYFMLAAKSHKEDYVEKLNSTFILSPKDFHDSQLKPLSYVTLSGDLEALRILLVKGVINPSKIFCTFGDNRDDYLARYIHRYLEKSDPNIVSLLISGGFNPCLDHHNVQSKDLMDPTQDQDKLYAKKINAFEMSIFLETTGVFDVIMKHLEEKINLEIKLYYEIISAQALDPSVKLVDYKFYYHNMLNHMLFLLSSSDCSEPHNKYYIAELLRKGANPLSMWKNPYDSYSDLIINSALKNRQAIFLELCETHSPRIDEIKQALTAKTNNTTMLIAVHTKNKEALLKMIEWGANPLLTSSKIPGMGPLHREVLMKDVAQSVSTRHESWFYTVLHEAGLITFFPLPELEQEQEPDLGSLSMSQLLLAAAQLATLSKKDHPKMELKDRNQSYRKRR